MSFNPSVGAVMATGRDARGGYGGGVGEERGRRKKVELLQEAIHGVLEEKKIKRRQQRRHGEEEGSVSMIPRERDQEQDLLLLSRWNSLMKDVGLSNDDLNSSHQDLESRNEAERLRDIAKDLDKIKRQNRITHILLGTLIVMTAVWQFNEVSFLLAVKRKLSNPFKSLGDMIKGALKGRGRPMIEASPQLPPIGVPDVTRTDLQMLAIGSSGS